MSDKDEFDIDREIFESATDGPWEMRAGWGMRLAGTVDVGPVIGCWPFNIPPISCEEKADAQFIARARTRWPICDEERRRLLEENERLKMDFAKSVAALELLTGDLDRMEDERDQLRAEVERLKVCDSECERLCDANHGLMKLVEAWRAAAEEYSRASGYERWHNIWLDAADRLAAARSLEEE